MRRRIVLLVTAVAVALLGTTVVFNVASKPAPQAAAAVADPQTKVLVAKALIPAGTPGAKAIEQGLVSLSDVPTRMVPAGALVDVVAVRDQVSAGDIQAGEILMPSRFVSATLAGSLDIPDDKVAVSIEVTDPQRVAGFVRPGLDVALFLTYEVLQPPQVPAEGQVVPTVTQATRLLLPRAGVIAVGPTALKTVGTAASAEEQATPPAEGAAAPQEVNRALVTLAVSIEQAQKLAHAARTGQITLGLLSKKSRTGTASADDNRTLFQ